ncbi:GntR family transcriptional regulator [Arthrobacter sp. N199823]|uniref:GntR family transcriptional regulator n=1 Tax=Arthrobacter sp. N199823 TaxID=2058895 RepID=UPI002157487F|nr:GntR family transcriptional regulator [Arthrobacter sp. N199823]
MQHSHDNPEPALNQSVQDEIRQDIILGVLPSGSRVTESALAKKYGMSRVPVREALRGLEMEGFVVSRPYAGSTVAAIPVDEADDLFAVRESLESVIARRSARRAAAQFTAGQPDDGWWKTRKEIAGILQSGDAAVAADEQELLPDLNIRFHLAIAELSASTSLGALLRQIARKIEWLYATDVSSRGKHSWAEHWAIMAAIDAGNADLAGELMCSHVHQSWVGYASRFHGVGAELPARK